jgi:hypothetical protein
VSSTLGIRLRQIRTDFLEAFHEREDLLRRELVRDADIDAIRAARNARSATAARPGRPDPTEDTDDDDGELPYSFF